MPNATGGFDVCCVGGWVWPPAKMDGPSAIGAMNGVRLGWDVADSASRVSAPLVLNADAGLEVPAAAATGRR